MGRVAQKYGRYLLGVPRSEQRTEYGILLFWVFFFF
jgi:hypothetical protein